MDRTSAKGPVEVDHPRTPAVEPMLLAIGWMVDRPASVAPLPVRRYPSIGR